MPGCPQSRVPSTETTRCCSIFAGGFKVQGELVGTSNGCHLCHGHFTKDMRSECAKNIPEGKGLTSQLRHHQQADKRTRGRPEISLGIEENDVQDDVFVSMTRWGEGKNLLEEDTNSAHQSFDLAQDEQGHRCFGKVPQISHSEIAMARLAGERGFWRDVEEDGELSSWVVFSPTRAIQRCFGRDTAGAIMWTSTDFLCRITAPQCGRRALRLSYVCPRCGLYWLEDQVQRVTSGHGDKKKENENNHHRS